MTKIHHGPRERAAEQGVDALGDAELVALVLGTGSQALSAAKVAQALLDDFGGMTGLAHAGVGELAAQRGLGLAKGARIAAAVELGKRLAEASFRHDGESFGNAAIVDAWARPKMAGLEHEELWALALDGRNRLRAARRIAVGGLHGLHVQTRDVLRSMVREAASAFVLVHNHPSGDAWPSEHDLLFTRKVAEAGLVVGTPLVDHVVIGSPGYTSLLEIGALK
ncbi:MAG TPA: DNA repair protein RadC [Polyangiaceae bacterium]